MGRELYVRAVVEIIDLKAARERRQLAAGRPPFGHAATGFAWVPFWFFGPVWMVMPVSAGEQRDG